MNNIGIVYISELFTSTCGDIFSQYIAENNGEILEAKTVQYDISPLSKRTEYTVRLPYFTALDYTVYVPTVEVVTAKEETINCVINNTVKTYRIIELAPCEA